MQPEKAFLQSDSATFHTADQSALVSHVSQNALVIFTAAARCVCKGVSMFSLMKEPLVIAFEVKQEVLTCEMAI